MKPFRRPTFLGKSTLNGPPPPEVSEPPQKKRRISEKFEAYDTEAIAAAANILKQPKSLDKFQAPAVRKPLDNVQIPNSNLPPGSHEPTRSEGYYAVLWRKFTMKKNKTWDGDGVLSVSGGYAHLQDISGKELGKAACKAPLLVGSEMSIGGKDIEVESMISKEDFLAGRPFLGGVKQPPLTLKQIDPTEKITLKAQAKHNKIAESQRDQLHSAVDGTKASKGAFKAPLLNNTGQPQTKDSKVPTPRHDPSVEGALVMKRPRSAPPGKQIVDVVVDPLLTKTLREHQRAGVAFMYECVMGMKDYDGEGAILADEMGLGKTLQTIALLWTLLKQNPVYEEAPVIKKALIVCPVTLINNWRKEFKKWLGSDRIGVFVAEDNKVRLTDFTMGKSYSVMIIGYEKLRMVQADLQKGTGIDIVIADEGHRLKTAQNKSALAIKSLNTERRIILSGTPIQNDLAEFYTMVDFVNPGLLNKYTTFKKEFETPILQSQQPGASDKDLEKGEARSEELANITGKFILRRTAEILSKYLPPKTEYVVFCKPTEAQKSIYRAIIGSPTFNAALGSSSVSLELINILKKVCNSPNLLLKKTDKDENSTKQDLLESISPSLLKSPSASGKLQVLDSLLHRIRTTRPDEKVVLVSNYTSTMDVLAQLLSSLDYKFVRLDGTTPQKKRQDIVDRFNRSPPSNSFVFLLSAKAGGVGLNLIGASRLVLFDLDWNPATDLQAMARVHRDGQKRPCYIYRLITQGALDEKIFQRQVSKTGLADSIVDSKNSVSGFTRDELRDLFTLDESDDCQTHKLLSCSCGGKGMPLAEPEAEADSPRNDLAALSVGGKDERIIRDENGTQIIRLEEEDELPKSPQWKNAKNYDWKAEETERLRKAKECKDSNGKAKMLSLMRYAHFDTALIEEMRAGEKVDHEDGDESEDELPPADPLEGAIEDDALRNVLHEEGRRIGFVFSKLSC
ncbi:helicase [Vermiconidia calcicola]|uniref:Helicase n=1 Tax=Vermiconidia calcicola TaxID=1690605 RepID=A0ACC3MIM6_9PEZI|nr:helicase [Vermiconidia calcicola]